MSEDPSPEDAPETTEEESEKMKTMLYAFPREALRASDLKEIRDALEDAGYSMTTSEDGDNVMIQRPKETGTNVNVTDVLGE